MRTLAVIVLALCLAGCATKYQEMGFMGGVAAEQVTSDTWRIVARGNAYTGGTRIQDFVLMKAAETTKAAGAKYFVIGGSQDASSQGAISTPATAQTTFVGGSAFTTFNPGSVYTYVKPGQDTYVRVLRLPPGAPPPPGALDADEIINFVGPRLRGWDVGIVVGAASVPRGSGQQAVVEMPVVSDAAGLKPGPENLDLLGRVLIKRQAG